MKNDHLIKQLNALGDVQPDANFAAGSKAKIIYRISQKPGGFFVVSQSLSSTLAIGLVIVLFVFVAISGVSNVVRDPIFPTFEGVNGASLTAEAGDVRDTIDIQLQEVKYLARVSTGTVARAEAGEVIISNPEEESTDEEIDNLLDQAINY